LNPACAQSQIRPTLGAPRPWTTTGNATAQRKARSAHRCPPRHDPTLTRRTYFSFCGGPIHARLTNPAKQNIIPSIRGSKRQVADIKSEPRPASNRNQWPASFWNAWPASSESAVSYSTGVVAPLDRSLAKSFELASCRVRSLGLRMGKRRPQPMFRFAASVGPDPTGPAAPTAVASTPRSCCE
jgi:hypothetical protein